MFLCGLGGLYAIVLDTFQYLVPYLFRDTVLFYVCHIPRLYYLLMLVQRMSEFWGPGHFPYCIIVSIYFNNAITFFHITSRFKNILVFTNLDNRDFVLDRPS